MGTLVTKVIEIDMGHRVPNHKSKCKNLHGHRYRFEVAVDGELAAEQGSSDEGMVIDFSDLKQVMAEEIDEPLDHGFMMYEKDPLKSYFSEFKEAYGQKIIFVPFVPTVENIAQYAYNRLKSRLETERISLEYVQVWETSNSSALYRPIKRVMLNDILF